MQSSSGSSSVKRRHSSLLCRSTCCCVFLRRKLSGAEHTAVETGVPLWFDVRAVSSFSALSSGSSVSFLGDCTECFVSASTVLWFADNDRSTKHRLLPLFDPCGGVPRSRACLTTPSSLLVLFAKSQESAVVALIERRGLGKLWVAAVNERMLPCVARSERDHTLIDQSSA